MIRISHILFVLCFAMLAAGCGSRENAETAVLRASEAAAAGRYDEALDLANRAVGLAPERVDALLLQAVLLEKRGKLDEAVKAAGKAASLAPENFHAQYTVGRLYARNPAQYAQDALIALGKALNLRPGDRNTLILLTNVNMRQYPEQAQKYLLQLGRDQTFAATAEYQNQLGICLAYRKSYQSAGKFFLKACQLQPDQPTITYNLAVCMDRYLGRAKLAEPFYRKYLQLSPITPEFQHSRRIAAERIKAVSR